MKKVVITCGLISGAIVAALMGINMVVCTTSMDFERSEVLGYASIILAFSLIFVGVKIFRDRHNGGVISFGKAFKIGLFITLIASAIHVGVWAIEYHTMYPDFMEQYSNHMIDKMKSSGASQAAIDASIKEMAVWGERYKNPVFFILMTAMETLPAGLIISLISALILKRGNKRAGIA
jgi:hypothetical protein